MNFFIGGDFEEGISALVRHQVEVSPNRAGLENLKKELRRVKCKLRQINWQGVAIRQKLAGSEIICISTYVKSMVIIRLNPNLNNYILDDYGVLRLDYYST